MADNGHTATDIITYIGVPLAVLGVLPIMYNTFLTLVNASKIKRMLRHSRLTALTRSDVVNRVIEIELPRYAVTPWDRFQHRGEYWQVARNPSAIPGGSWTTFNWRTNAIGFKTQRVEYADQLRQPQVEVSFEELVSYLLDLGAVPDAHGWRLLRSTGMWTPVGCALMRSPDGHHTALAIAPLDDSDGNLSLSVTWQPGWTSRNYADLPPYWVSLPARKTAGEGSQEAPAAPADTAPITCQISVEGIIMALTEDADKDKDKDAPPTTSIGLDSLNIEHVRVRPGSTAGVWFASAATAFGTSSQTMLWNYRIPEDVLAFARRETVPCGVLVLVGLARGDETPEWATQYTDDNTTAVQAFAQRHQEQRLAVAAESQLPPDARAAAARARVQRENMQRLADMQAERQRAAARSEKHENEALSSPKWDARLVGEHALRWLREHKKVDPGVDARVLAGHVLHRMVRDEPFAVDVGGVLDRWRAWADRGGMKRADVQQMHDDTELFCQAALLVALICDSANALQGTLAVDLQECMRLWHKVRLG